MSAKLNIAQRQNNDLKLEINGYNDMISKTNKLVAAKATGEAEIVRLEKEVQKIPALQLEYTTLMTKIAATLIKKNNLKKGQPGPSSAHQQEEEIKKLVQ